MLLGLIGAASWQRNYTSIKRTNKETRNDYLKTKHQLFDHGEWCRSDVIHSEAREIDKYDHSSDKQLLVFVSQHFRDHETCALDVLELYWCQ